MTPRIDEIKPYRLEARNLDVSDAWRYVMAFGADKLESYWGIMKAMNGVSQGLLLQIVPNFSAVSSSARLKI